MTLKELNKLLESSKGKKEKKSEPSAQDLIDESWKKK